MQFYRPPGGEFNEETLMVAQEIGLIPVLWSLAYNDWQRDRTVGKKVVLDTVMGRMHSGAIMLFHITSADVPAALPDIIDTLRSQGYTIGEPQDLLDLAGKTPAQ
jgi:peptidoglycan-N-acetylmuramic acid deacetylase